MRDGSASLEVRARSSHAPPVWPQAPWSVDDWGMNMPLNRRDITIISPAPAGTVQGLRELWRYRDLMRFFAWRDIAVRYKQTVVGFAWTIIQPLTTTAIFTVVLGGFAGLPSSGRPYAVLTLAGLIAWMAFSAALIGAAGSVLSDQSVIQKVYYPRLATTLSAVGPIMLDAGVWAAMLVVLVAVTGIGLSLTLLAIPLVITWAIIVGLALGIWLAPLNVRYRDIRYVIPFILQAWLYVSPVAYSSIVVPGQWRPLYELNPTVLPIEAMRWAVFGTIDIVSPASVIASTFAVVLTLWFGIKAFGRAEGTFADEI